MQSIGKKERSSISKPNQYSSSVSLNKPKSPYSKKGNEISKEEQNQQLMDEIG
jgi:hypothetical protein